jgi:hypothetical protein
VRDLKRKSCEEAAVNRNVVKVDEVTCDSDAASVTEGGSAAFIEPSMTQGVLWEMTSKS